MVKGNLSKVGIRVWRAKFSTYPRNKTYEFQGFN
jgi:hypothetical protein